MILNPVWIVKKKYEFKYLNSMNPFILPLVTAFVGPLFKILRISWYKCITPFLDNLQLVMCKYLFHLHDSFPGINYISNKQVLSGTSK